jgi:hypothetical protein
VILDEDALVAAVELIGRAGASDVELGHLYDDDTPPPGWPPGIPVPVEACEWYVAARWKGARLTVDGYTDPITAAEALARRVLDGAHCVKCGRPIRLDARPGCRWHRNGPHYYRGCDGGRGGSEPIEPNRAARRAARKGNR